MDPPQARDLGAAILEAALKFIPILIITLAFAAIYWRIAKRRAERKELEQLERIEERRVARAEGRHAPPSRGRPNRD